MLRKITRRVALCVVLASAVGTHAAAAFPDKPVKLVVPFPPGGLTGAVALAIANKMGPVLGQPVVLDNRPGAAGTIAAAAVAKAPRDGYTLLFGTSATQGIARYMYKALPYDPIEDFVPVGIIGNVTVGVFASEKSGFRTVQDVFAAVRDYDAPAWLGIVAPRGTPPDAVDKLEKALGAALADQDVRSLMVNLGIDAEPMTAQELGLKMKREMPLWEEAVRAAGAGGAELK